MTIEAIFQVKNQVTPNSSKVDLKATVKNDFSNIFNKHLGEQKNPAKPLNQIKQPNSSEEMNSTKPTTTEKSDITKQELQSNKATKQSTEKAATEEVVITEEDLVTEDSLIPYELLLEEIIALLNQLNTTSLGDAEKTLITGAISQISEELIVTNENLADTLSKLLGKLEEDIQLTLTPEDKEIILEKLTSFMQGLKQPEKPVAEKEVQKSVLMEALPTITATVKPVNLTTKPITDSEVVEEETNETNFVMSEQQPVNASQQTKNKAFIAVDKLQEPGEVEVKETPLNLEGFGLSPEKNEAITKFANMIQQEIQNNEPQNLLNQIVNKVEVLVQNNKSEFKMQLSPESLGNLLIKISVEKGIMTAKVFTENYQIKELLESNLNQLRINLGEKGINVSSLEVSVGQQQESFQFTQSQLQQKPKLKKLSAVGASATNYIEDAAAAINPYVISSNFDGLA